MALIPAGCGQIDVQLIVTNDREPARFGTDTGIDSVGGAQSTIDTANDRATEEESDNFPEDSPTTGTGSDGDTHVGGDVDTDRDRDTETNAYTGNDTEVDADTGEGDATDTGDGPAEETDSGGSMDAGTATGYETDTPTASDTESESSTPLLAGKVICDGETGLQCDLTTGDICCLAQDWVGQNNCTTSAACPAEGNSGPQDAFHTCDSAADCPQGMYCVYQSYYPEVKTYCTDQPQWEHFILIRTVCDPAADDCPAGQTCTPRRFVAGNFVDEDVGMHTCERPECPGTASLTCQHYTDCQSAGGLENETYGCGDSSQVCCEMP